jgi:hypothetical protein
LSIEGEYPERPREGPKLFTEYESSALFALAVQLGVGTVGVAWLGIVFILIPVFMALGPMWSTPLSLVMGGLVVMAFLIPVSLAQSYFGWRLHQRTTTVDACIKLDLISLLLCVVGIILIVAAAPILILLGIQMFAGVLVTDILAVWLLRSESARREFRTEAHPSHAGYPEYSDV